MVALEGNAEVAAVYFLARRQVVTVGSQMVDLDIKAVKIVMDLLGVSDQRSCLHRVLALWFEIDGKTSGDAS